MPPPAARLNAVLRRLAVLVLAGLGAAAAAAGPRVFVLLAPADPEAGTPALEAARGEVIVRFRPGAARQPAVQAAGGTAWREIGRRSPRRLQRPGGGFFEDAAVLTLPAGADVLAAARALAARPDVRWAEPNFRLRLAAEGIPAGGRVPNDFEFPRQWALHNTGQTGGRPGADIGAPAAWSLTTGSRRLVVAVIDTGVDYFHPDLGTNMWSNPGEAPGNGLDDDGNGYVDDVRGHDFAYGDQDPMDDNGHGTHVAGIIGAIANNETGVAGVAWDVQLMALKAFDEGGSAAVEDTLAAVRYAVDNGAQIINASWGGATPSRALEDAVAEAAAAGVLFVAAAGNNGSEAPFHPAAVPGALAVAATDARDASARFSNHGRYVALAAPGDLVTSTLPNDAVGELSGTSMAAPHVAGAAVLVWSRRPEFTAAEVAEVLRNTADPLQTDRFTGAGRLNLPRALAVPSPLPRVRLDVPAVAAGVLDVRGAAAAPDLAHFTLELGAGDRPTNWTTLGTFPGPVTDGVLLPAWNTAAFADGAYELRLTARNTAGFAAQARAPVRVRNVHLASPQNNDVLPAGRTYALRGTVFGAGRAFRLEWGPGADPAAWRTDGFTTAGGENLVDAELGRWDARVAGTNQFVTLRLTAVEGGRTIGDARARLVFLDGTLQPGFPLALGAGAETPRESWREYNLADLDGDGAAELIAVDFATLTNAAPRLAVHRGDGSLLWARDLPPGLEVPDDPTVGDLDGDGRPEVLVEAGPDGLVFAFRGADGADFGPGWPAALPGRRWAKSLADLDGDGRAELIAVAEASPRRLVVADAAGAVRAQWPLADCADAPQGLRRYAAVAELDGRPGLEIVAVNGCQTLAAYAVGEDAPRWAFSADGRLDAAPVAADLDGDGRDEVLLAVRSTGGSRPGGLHAVDGAGRRFGNFPVLLEDSFLMPPAVGDVDGDGRPEIALVGAASRRLHLLDSGGFPLPGWPTGPMHEGSPASAPILADLEGDGVAEVLLAMAGQWSVVHIGADVARAGQLRAWSAAGFGLDLQPHPLLGGLVMEGSGGAWFKAPAAAAADVDGDGRLELVAASIEDTGYSNDRALRVRKARGSLYAWPTGAPVAGGRSPWPAIQGGPARTGRLDPVRPANLPPRVDAIPPQTVPPGGSFRRLTLDRYVEDPDDRAGSLVWRAAATAGLAVSISPARVAEVTPAWPATGGRGEVTFTVRDPAGNEASVTTVFAVVPGFIPPSAQPDAAATDEDVAVEIAVLANDSVPGGGAPRLLQVSRPAHGATRLLPDGRVEYRPARDFWGTDAFEYVIADDRGGSAAGEVTVTVRPMPDPPVAVPDQLILDEDTVAAVNVLANDHDPDGDAPALAGFSQPAHGAAAETAPGVIEYRPRPDYFGPDALTYVVTDGALTATGTVAVIVRPVNDPPRAGTRRFTVNRNGAVDIPLEADDPDGDALVFRIGEGPAHGVLLAYPTLASYAPARGFAGADRFTYFADDGIAPPAEGVVELTVLATNNPPRVSPAETVTAVEQAVAIALTVTDADEDPVTLRLRQPPANGVATPLTNGFRYRPAAGFVGTDRFEVEADDGQAASAPAAVTVRVTDTNSAPVAEPFFLSVTQNQPAPLRLRARDAENNPLTFLVVTNPARGELSGAAPDLTYRPRPNFTGFDRLAFAASDGRLTSEVAVVTLRVQRVNRPPVATNSTVVGVRGQPVDFTLPATDPEGGGLAVAILRGPRYGRVIGTGTRLRYVPQPGFGGTDSFTWKVWDGLAASPAATTTLVLEETPPPPLVRLRWLPDALAGPGLRLVAEPSRAGTLVLETSENLAAWMPLETRPTPGGTELFLVPPPGDGSAPARFFRALLQP